MPQNPTNQRSYLSDFIGGVDPTGTSTFQYGMQDAQRGESSGLRRGIGTAGGILGGAAVLPAAVGGIVGGVKGGLLGKGSVKSRALGALKGFLSGAKKPYTSLYRGARAQSALAAHQAGKTLTPGQATAIQKFVKTQVPEGLSQLPNFGPESISGALSQLTPQQLSAVKRNLGAELGAGAASLGLSGLVSGGSAYAQYGKGGTTGEVLRKQNIQ